MGDTVFFAEFVDMFFLCFVSVACLQIQYHCFFQVCLSLLGTWHGGDASEKWDSKKSSLYQVCKRLHSFTDDVNDGINLLRPK